MGICLLVCLAVRKCSVGQLLPLVTLSGSHNRRRCDRSFGQKSRTYYGATYVGDATRKVSCFALPLAGKLEISSLRRLSRSGSAVHSNFAAGSRHTVGNDGQPKGVCIDELKITLGPHTVLKSLVELCSFTGRLVLIRVCQLFPTARRARYL
jgi:hypothetical protein